MSLFSRVAFSLKLHIDKPVKRAERRLLRTRGKRLYLYSRESIGKNANGPGSHVLGNGNGLKSPGGGIFTLVTP